MWFLFGVLWAQEPDSAEQESDTGLEEQQPFVESKAELPKVRQKSVVQYPEAALDEGFGGELLLELFIDKNGNVLSSMVQPDSISS